MASVEEKRREDVGLQEILDDLSSRKDVAERKNEEMDVEEDRLLKGNMMIVCKNPKDEDYRCGRDKVAPNRISEVQKRENGGLDCSEKDVSDNDEESISSNLKEGILTETKTKIEEFTGESTNRSEEIMRTEECMWERTNQKEGIQGEASPGLDCEALPTLEGDMNAPIDIESDSIVEISDSEDSLGSGDGLPPNNRIERPLSGQRCDEHLISCKKELPDGLTLKRKWGAEAGTGEIKTEGEAKRSKIDAAKNVLVERFSMEMQTPNLAPPSQNIDELLNNCKEELPHSLSPKQKWGAEMGTSEIWTEYEDKTKKVDAAQNSRVEPSSMQMQTPGSSPMGFGMRCRNFLFNESRSMQTSTRTSIAQILENFTLAMPVQVPRLCCHSFAYS